MVKLLCFSIPRAWILGTAWKNSILQMTNINQKDVQKVAQTVAMTVTGVVRSVVRCCRCKKQVLMAVEMQ
jgi:hypothetical protein